MQIKVKESTVVRPAKANPTRSLWLSSLDLVMPTNNHIHFNYFFRRHSSSSSSNNFFDSTVMKEALSQALVHFYPIAGRLKIHNDRFEIDCNGQGVLFVEAEADGGMDELTADFAPRPADLPLIPKVDYSLSFPLFLAQVTRFKCGGVCLVVAVDHHVADGTSAAHFINSWAEIARCQDVMIPPVIDRKPFGL